jgi:hypothetical protein
MTEGNYSNVGHRGPVYKVLGAMNPCDLSMCLVTHCALSKSDSVGKVTRTGAVLRRWSEINNFVSTLLNSELRAAVLCCWAVLWLGKRLRWKLGFFLLYTDQTKWGKYKFYVTFNKVQMKTGSSHISVLMVLFDRKKDWSTKTAYGFGAQIVYMLCCLLVCVGVTASVV